jgi:hypothetical protein
LKQIHVSPLQSLISKVRFRICNFPRYVERMRAIGWMSTETMTGKALSSRAGSH